MKDGNNTNAHRWFSFNRSYCWLTAPHALVIAGVVIALSMAAICAMVLYESRLDSMARATETSHNLALLAERDIERNFELYALSLQAAVDGVNDPEVMAASPRLRRFALFDRAATATYLGATSSSMPRTRCQEKETSRTANTSRRIGIIPMLACTSAIRTCRDCAVVPQALC